MAKKKKIKTLQDIIDVVNSDNLDVFMKDFRNFLENCIVYKSVNIPGLKFGGARMTWIDDGKNEMTHHIIIKKKR